jgi:dTDP-4-dehydrorhamnose reductase
VEVLTDRVEILSKSAVAAYIEEKNPDMVIHCAGDGRADVAQKDPEWAYRINVEATRNIFDGGGKDRHMVYISSNAVYRGTLPPYGEDHFKNPINEYGKSKMMAELSIEQEANAGALGPAGKLTIIRPIFLFGWILPGRRLHFINRLLQSMETGKPSGVANDIYTQPTYAWDCAAAIWELAQKQDQRVDDFNIAPRVKMSLYEFARVVARVFGYSEELILPIASNDLQSFAPRPRDTTYDTSKAFVQHGVRLPNCLDGLERMKDDREAKNLGLLLY